jgi:hypothetical protein
MILVTGRRVLGATEQPFGTAPMSPRQAELASRSAAMRAFS